MTPFTRRGMLLSAASVAACANARAGAGDDLAGAWEGRWTKQGADLPVVVYFQRIGEGYRGAFDSDDLQVIGIPFRTVERDGEEVSFVLAGDQTTTTFRGRLADNGLEGAFDEAGVPGSFALTRLRSAPASPIARPLTFASGDVTLSGEVLIGEGDGRRPGVIFMHGSGAQGRWSNRYLATRFARAGFAALIFDKRGVGESAGDWRASGLDQLASDGATAFDALAAQPEADARRIGVYGHSQGSTVAALVGAERAVKFVIGSAATGVSPADTEIYSISNNLGAPRRGGAERDEVMDFACTLVAVAYNGAPRAELDRIVTLYQDRPWYFAPPPPENFYWTFSRRVAALNPSAIWAAVRAPVLLLWGGADQRVPPGESAAILASAMAAAGNARVTTRIYENADHSFRLAGDAAWPQRAFGYVDQMLAWARAFS